MIRIYTTSAIKGELVAGNSQQPKPARVLAAKFRPALFLFCTGYGPTLESIVNVVFVFLNDLIKYCLHFDLFSTLSCRESLCLANAGFNIHLMNYG
jgi:hypothetical protein